VLFPVPFLNGAHSLWVFGPVPGGFGSVLRPSSGYFGEVVVVVGVIVVVVGVIVVVFFVGRWGSTAAIAAAEGLFFFDHRGMVVVLAGVLGGA